MALNERVRSEIRYSKSLEDKFDCWTASGWMVREEFVK